MLGLLVIIPIRMILEEAMAPAVIAQSEGGRGAAPALQARALTFARKAAKREDAAVVEPYCAIRAPTGDMVSLHQVGKTVTLCCLTERLTSAIKLFQLGQALVGVEGMMPEAA